MSDCTTDLVTGNRPTDAADSAQYGVTARHCPCDMSPHRNVGVDEDAEVADRTDRGDGGCSDCNGLVRNLMLMTSRRTPEQIGLGGIELQTVAMARIHDATSPTHPDKR